MRFCRFDDSVQSSAVAHFCFHAGGCRLLISLSVTRALSRRRGPPSQAAELSGYAATFLLGIYGGFFSGGYVTMLTPIFVVCFSMTFVQAVANTKLVNIFSSLVATLIFMWYSPVDYRLGHTLAVTAFLGAIVGARIALKLDNLWLRRIFLTTVVALALKTLLYDFAWQQLF